MSRLDEAYALYLKWCADNNQPALDPLQYEKVTASLPSTPNNIDAILRNNNRKKDKK